MAEVKKETVAKKEAKVEEVKTEAKVETKEVVKEVKKDNGFVKYVAPKAGVTVVLGDLVFPEKGTAIVDQAIWNKCLGYLGGYIVEITKAEFDKLQKAK